MLVNRCTSQRNGCQAFLAQTRYCLVSHGVVLVGAKLASRSGMQPTAAFNQAVEVVAAPAWSQGGEHQLPPATVVGRRPRAHQVAFISSGPSHTPHPGCLRRVAAIFFGRA